MRCFVVLIALLPLLENAFATIQGTLIAQNCPQFVSTTQQIIPVSVPVLDGETIFVIMVLDSTAGGSVSDSGSGNNYTQILGPILFMSSSYVYVFAR
jgi:hypothetical protein